MAAAQREEGRTVFEHFWHFREVFIFAVHAKPGCVIDSINQQAHAV